MNAAVCPLLYGIALGWMGPPALVRLTRRGLNPRLAIATWLIAIAVVVTAWVFASMAIAVEVLSTHAAAPLQYCVDALLAINDIGWIGHLAVVSAAVATTVLSFLAARRVAVILRRLWSRSKDHAHTARMLGSHSGPSGVVVLSAQHPTAYCVAGRPHAIVVTTGAVDRLSEDELVAVLAHERAHIAGRHPQMMMVLRSIATAIPRFPLFAAAVEAVGSLVEVSADDRAAQRYGRDALLRGLIALAGYRPAPGAALAAADTAVAARAARLLDPAGRVIQLRNRIALIATVALFVTTPVVITLACRTP